jgi:phosphomannomutase/phosphoglucomutase
MSATTINPHIFRKNDIRGIYPDELNPETVYKIGMAYGTSIKEYFDKNITVSVGYDARSHSEIIADALIRGLSDTGIQVLEIGMCPTPVLYFSNFIKETKYQNLLNLPDINGAIMITGSHNPPEYNGLKMLIDNKNLKEDDIKKLKDIVNEESYSKSPSQKSIKIELNSIYKEYLLSQFGIFKDVNVVIDSANGTAGLIVPDLLQKLGCNVIQLFSKPDGSFPFHHPDPTLPENMKMLGAIVQDNNSDIGIGYDGDTDRLGLISKTGKIIWGDDLMIIFAREIARGYADKSKLKFIGEVKCSQRMYDFIEMIGAIPIMYKTGHSFIKEKMKEENAVLACEMSGHVFFADKYFGYDDAIYATLRILEIIDQYKQREGDDFIIDNLLKELPEPVSTPEIRTKSTDNRKFKIIEKIAKEIELVKDIYNIKDIITIDGLRLVFDDGFALVRASNTEPILVTRFEARTYENLEKYQRLLNDLIEKHNK